ncbi:hypothetical protein TYRP_017785 [Tyrophagus putrescentiae]|nr:hypothetical protein TYRP_017785 [Tyrophagus putrescentiae]
MARVQVSADGGRLCNAAFFRFAQAAQLIDVARAKGEEEKEDNSLVEGDTILSCQLVSSSSPQHSAKCTSLCRAAFQEHAFLRWAHCSVSPSEHQLVPLQT